jgi:hypothetical protein
LPSRTRTMKKRLKYSKRKTPDVKADASTRVYTSAASHSRGLMPMSRACSARAAKLTRLSCR